MIPGITDLPGAAVRLQRARQNANPEAREVEVAGAQLDPDLARYRYLVGRRFARGADLEVVPRVMRPFGFRPETLLLPGLDAVAERTLIIWGDRDNQVAMAPARAELQRHPATTLRVLAGAGHLLPFEDPGGTALEVAHWCGGVGASTLATAPTSTNPAGGATQMIPEPHSPGRRPPTAAPGPSGPPSGLAGADGPTVPPAGSAGSRRSRGPGG